MVPCNLNSGEKEAVSSSAISKVISYFGQKKNQEWELQLQEPMFFSSLHGPLHTRLHSPILLDVWFLFTFYSCLPTPASFQISEMLIRTNLDFHNVKLP